CGVDLADLDATDGLAAEEVVEDVTVAVGPEHVEAVVTRRMLPGEDAASGADIAGREGVVRHLPPPRPAPRRSAPLSLSQLLEPSSTPRSCNPTSTAPGQSGRRCGTPTRPRHRATLG